MSSRDDRRDDDLEARLDELESVLTELRRDLRETERDRRGPPRPPRLSELVRFTEQYTIPTVIALLETTIKSLELLQGTLRLADPARDFAEGAERTGDRLDSVRDGASAGLARSLSELRTALSEADLPEEAASRSIISDARDLTAEIEARIEESRREADGRRSDGRRTGDRGRRDSDDGDGGIQIDVTEPGDESEAAADRGVENRDDAEDDPAPEVDIDSELESIKRQFDDDADAEHDPDAAAERDEHEADDGGDAGSGGDAGDGSEAGSGDDPNDAKTDDD